MKSTINTEAGRIVIEASTGRVTSNGAVLLPHEAFLIGSEMQRAAERAEKLAQEARGAWSNALATAAAVPVYPMPL